MSLVIFVGWPWRSRSDDGHTGGGSVLIWLRKFAWLIGRFLIWGQWLRRFLHDRLTVNSVISCALCVIYCPCLWCLASHAICFPVRLPEDVPISHSSVCNGVGCRRFHAGVVIACENPFLLPIPGCDSPGDRLSGGEKANLQVMRIRVARIPERWFFVLIENLKYSLNSEIQGGSRPDVSQTDSHDHGLSNLKWEEDALTLNFDLCRFPTGDGGGLSQGPDSQVVRISGLSLHLGQLLLIEAEQILGLISRAFHFSELLIHSAPLKASPNHDDYCSRGTDKGRYSSNPVSQIQSSIPGFSRRHILGWMLVSAAITSAIGGWGCLLLAYFYQMSFWRFLACSVSGCSCLAEPTSLASMLVVSW